MENHDFCICLNVLSWKLEKEKGKTYSPTILFFGFTKTRARVFRKSSKRERNRKRKNSIIGG